MAWVGVGKAALQAYAVHRLRGGALTRRVAGPWTMDHGMILLSRSAPGARGGALTRRAAGPWTKANCTREKGPPPVLLTATGAVPS